MSVFGWPDDFQLDTWAAVMLGCLCLAALITDLRRSVIPNFLTIPFACAGIILHGLIHGWEGLGFAAGGAAAGLISVGLMYLCKGVGAGDVKLFAAIGSLAGWKFVLALLFYTVMISGLIGAWLLAARFLRRNGGRLLLERWVLALANRNLAADRRKPDRYEPMRFPFMIAVAPAVLLMYGFI